MNVNRGFQWISLLAGVLLAAALSRAAAQGKLACLPYQVANGELAGSSLSTISVAQLRVPEKARQHFLKACEALQGKRYEESERESVKALEIAPNFANVYLLRAERQLLLHQYDEAIQSTLSAQKIEPTIGWAGVLLAGAYNGEQRYEDAAIILENLHGAEAETWQASYEKARVAIGRNDVLEGLRWSEIALETAPAGMLDAHLLRANALVVAGRWSAATRELETYLALDKSSGHRPDVVAMLTRMQALAAGQEQATSVTEASSR